MAERNAAPLRGDIQRGLTGAKAPALDPAAAPLETDGEAGGFTLGAETVAAARAEASAAGPPDTGRNASSNPDIATQSDQPPAWSLRMILAVVAGVLALAAILFSLP